MKKLFLIPLVILVVGALIFGGCKAAPPVEKEIRVGCVVALTGMYAGFGQGGEFGMRAAVDDINKQGGVYVEELGGRVPIRFIVTDSESDPMKVGTLAENLVVRDKVHFLVSPIIPPTMVAPVATTADRYKMPHVAYPGPIEPWMGMRMEVTPPWQYTWATGFAIATPAPAGDFRAKPGYTIIDTWMAMLDLFGDQTNKKAGVFAADDADGVGWYALFPKALEEAGYDVLGEERDLGLTPFGTTDFTPVINEWKDYNVEVLWGNSPAPHWGAMWRQAHALGFKPKLVSAGRAALFYTDIAAWGGDLPWGIGTEIWWDTSYDPEVCPGIGGTTPKTLSERWAKETGQPLNPGIGSYHIVQILIDAIERAGTLDADKVNKAIGETDMMTICHRVLFDKETQFSRTPLTFGQWYKTDKPQVWECPIVFSKHDFIKAAGKPIFPVPYP